MSSTNNTYHQPRKKLKRLAITQALLLGPHLCLVKAEESSILYSATVVPVAPTELKNSTPDADVLLIGSFKSAIFLKSNLNPEIEVKLNLPKAEKLLTVVILADAKDNYNSDSLGNSQIWLDKNGSRTLAKSSVYDTGIYTLDQPTDATSIIFRRESNEN